jgi:Zn-dependent protease
MGHMLAIRGYGLRSSAPMFIPGLGAFIRLKDVRLAPVPDARIGLAGPVYGLGAALAAAGLWVVTRVPIWAAIAHFGALINLFNLIPVWSLDGARGLRSLSRGERGWVVAAAALVWMLGWSPMGFLIALAGTWRLFTRDWQTEGDPKGAWLFVGLLAALSVLMAVTAKP